jgi:hypothetical protein
MHVSVCVCMFYAHTCTNTYTHLRGWGLLLLLLLRKMSEVLLPLSRVVFLRLRPRLATSRSCRRRGRRAGAWRTVPSLALPLLEASLLSKTRLLITIHMHIYKYIYGNICETESESQHPCRAAVDKNVRVYISVKVCRCQMRVCLRMLHTCVKYAATILAAQHMDGVISLVRMCRFVLNALPVPKIKEPGGTFARKRKTRRPVRFTLCPCQETMRMTRCMRAPLQGVAVTALRSVAVTALRGVAVTALRSVTVTALRGVTVTALRSVAVTALRRDRDSVARRDRDSVAA